MKGASSGPRRRNATRGVSSTGSVMAEFYENIGPASEMIDLPPYEQLLAQAREVTAEVRPADESVASRTAPNLRLRNTIAIAGTTGIMFAYGYGTWWKDGFTTRFRTVSEGGFGRDTPFH